MKHSEALRGEQATKSENKTNLGKAQQPKALLRSLHRTFFWWCYHWCRPPGHSEWWTLVATTAPGRWMFPWLGTQGSRAEVWTSDWPSRYDLTVLLWLLSSKPVFPTGCIKEDSPESKKNLYTLSSKKVKKPWEKPKRALLRRWVSRTSSSLRMC